MKPNRRVVLATATAAVLLVAALAARWLTAQPATPPQETPAAVVVTGAEEALPDFQPTERLPADSAVAFPTDI